MRLGSSWRVQCRRPPSPAPAPDKMTRDEEGEGGEERDGGKRGREEGWRGRGGKARQGTIKMCEHRNYLVSISFQVDAHRSLLCCPAHYIHCPHHTREPPVPYGSTHPSYSTPTHSWPATHCTPYVLALVGAVLVTAEGADRLLKVAQATPAIWQWVTRTNTQLPSTQYTKMYPLKGLLFRYQ